MDREHVLFVPGKLRRVPLYTILLFSLIVNRVLRVASLTVTFYLSYIKRRQREKEGGSMSHYPRSMTCRSNDTRLP
jgi:hypothetical protein